MKVRGTFEGHTTGGGWIAVGVLALFIGVAVVGSNGPRIGRDAGHAAEIFLTAALAITAVVVTSLVALVIVARRHERRRMAEHANRPAQLPYVQQRAAAPSVPRREIHVYHHMDGLPSSAASSPVTAEILRGEILDRES